jgi:hypothetical protein
MLEDAKVPIRLKLSALWAALMFCYVYGDYFGLYRPGQLQGMLRGEFAENFSLAIASATGVSSGSAHRIGKLLSRLSVLRIFGFRAAR